MLARRWRPRDFSQMAGQEAVVQALVNGLNSGRIHHAFLFTGTRGVGKTTLARILAKCLNCEQQVSAEPCGECSACVAIDEGRFVDLIEVDAASRTKVDDTRELLDNVQYAATRGRYKVYLIDEVHMLSASSFNALLKTLEEPPAHVKFILATTDPQKIPVTILSRCVRFNLRRMPAEQINDYLSKRLNDEQIEFEAPALQAIARAGDGSMRDALSLLDQALAHGNGRLREEPVQTMLGMVEFRFIEQLLSALQTHDSAELLQIAAEIYAQGQSADRTLQQLAEALHRIAVLQQVPEYTDSNNQQLDDLKEFASLLPAEDVQLYYQIANLGRSELAHAPDPRIGLDMTLLRMLAFRPVAPSSDDQSADPPKRAASPAPAASQSSPVAAPITGQATPRAALAESPRPPVEPPIDTPRTDAPIVQQVSEAAPAASSDAAPMTLDAERWPGLCRQLGFSGPLRVLAQHLMPGEHVDQGVLLFKMEERDAHLHTQRLHKQLSQALVEHLQTPVKVKVQYTNDTLETPARLQAAADDQAHRKAHQVVAEDTVINDLIETFDARIVPGSVRPDDGAG